MKTVSADRFAEFWQSAFGTALTAITHGGQEMRTLVATVALSLVSCLPGQAQAQEQVALLARPASSGVTSVPSPADSRARNALMELMQVQCQSKSITASVAAGNLVCRFERKVSVEGGPDLLADADLVGELLGLPVFLSPSKSVYVSHMDSRGDGREWAPMLVMSEGMVDTLLPLPDGERKAALGFVLAREQALVHGASDYFADFEAFQYAYAKASAPDVAEAGISRAMAVEASHAGAAGDAQLFKRTAALKEYFDLEREMVAQAQAREATDRSVRDR